MIPLIWWYLSGVPIMVLLLVFLSDVDEMGAAAILLNAASWPLFIVFVLLISAYRLTSGLSKHKDKRNLPLDGSGK
jgi:hypothetical protein